MLINRILLPLLLASFSHNLIASSFSGPTLNPDASNNYQLAGSGQAKRLHQRCSNHLRQLKTTKARFNKRQQQQHDMTYKSKKAYKTLIKRYQTKIKRNCENPSLMALRG